MALGGLNSIPLPGGHQGYGHRLFVSHFPTMFKRSKLRKKNARKSFFTMRTVQVLEEMATAQGVQSILGDFPDPSGNNSEQPDLSRPCLKK